LLEASNQIVKLVPYAVNRTKRLIKTPKLYWTDPGLAFHIGHPDGGGEVGGALFENLVLCDLLVWRDVQVPHPNVMYWRTTGGHEVDFVLEHKRGLIGVEVKAGDHPTARDIGGLQAFLEEYPGRVRGGIVLHGGTKSYWMDEKVLAVPWHAVM